jgi:DNA-directed RNA polymerase subunit RPC12/RpoP
MVGSSISEVRRCGAPRALLSIDPDREMRCEVCGTRVFTSLAPELVRQATDCARCGVPMSLVPAQPAYAGH